MISEEMGDPSIWQRWRRTSTSGKLKNITRSIESIDTTCMGNVQSPMAMVIEDKQTQNKQLVEDLL